MIANRALHLTLVVFVTSALGCALEVGELSLRVDPAHVECDDTATAWNGTIPRIDALPNPGSFGDLDIGPIDSARTRRGSAQQPSGHISQPQIALIDVPQREGWSALRPIDEVNNRHWRAVQIAPIDRTAAREGAAALSYPAIQPIDARRPAAAPVAGIVPIDEIVVRRGNPRIAPIDAPRSSSRIDHSSIRPFADPLRPNGLEPF